jgi:hypothetical protein
MIPLDHGDCTNIKTCSGGSNGAHRGAPVWGSGQLNGYGSLQDAVDDHAPGLTSAFGDLQGSQGGVSVDLNFTIATPLGGFTAGVQIGTNGLAPYVGYAQGFMIGASETLSPTGVNSGHYHGSAACVFEACASANTQTPIAAGLGQGFPLGYAEEYRIGWKIGW